MTKRRSNIQLESKSRKRPKIEGSSDEDDNGEDSDNSIKETLKNIPNISIHQRKNTIKWPDSDMLILIERLQKHLPQEDTLSYLQRVRLIKWDQVAFKCYSGDECKKVWLIIQRQVRKFRLLGELADDAKKWISQPRKFNSSQVRRHPDMPKPPPQPFILYLHHNKKKLQKEHPEISYHDVLKESGLSYRQLPDEEKHKYQNLVKEMTKQYCADLQVFYEKHPDLIPLASKYARARLTTKQYFPPARPRKAFELFLDEEKKSQKEIVDNGEFKLACRNKWNQMKNSKKIFWLNWAEEKFRLYEEEMRQYVEKHPQYIPPLIKTILTQREMKLKKKFERPEKPPQSSYHLFLRLMLNDKRVLNVPHRERFFMINDMWRNTPEEERHSYQVRLDQLWEEYGRKLDKFLLQYPEKKRETIRIRELKVRAKLKSDGEHKRNGNKAKTGNLLHEPPLAPPKNDFQYFCSITDEPDPEEAWKKLSKKTRRKYAKIAEKMKDEYVTDYQRFLDTLNAN